MDKIINQAIGYAKKNKYRLLIEIEPDYKKIYVYCDEFNIAEIADILRKLKNIKIDYISTNFWIKYNYYPQINYLENPKWKTVKRFWKQTEFDLIEFKSKDIYFVELNDKFTEKEKRIYTKKAKTTNLKELSLDEIRLKFKDITFNVYNDFGIIFYK